MSRNIKNIDGIISDKYDVVFTKGLKDVDGLGIYLKHKKTGARLALISNSDENKVFCIGFKTPPEESTGVPHIVEHTVLCGSKKYPSKDPFVEMAKGSLNTFLNAMTFSDKTIYPIASCNDKDFSNLMSVYMDAVFFPNLHKNKAIFEQEGWHYELDGEELKINGVVYNEMKGAYSSPETIEDLNVEEALFPDVTYSKSSGGDPNVIPTLTYESYTQFHKKYYHPSNSYTILYGNFDIEDRLDFLDREYFSLFEKAEVDSSIPLQKPVSKDFTATYSIAESEEEQNKTFLSYNVVTGKSSDVFTVAALQLLRYVLVDATGAPLKKALIDAGIGKDISSSLSNHMQQPILSVHVTGTEASKKEEFVKIIEDTLKELVKNGLDKEKLNSAINYSEFKYREQDTGRYPKGLVMGIELYTTWLYDEDVVFDLMDAGDGFDKLRKKIGTGYFEELITKYILENPHKVVLALAPEKGKNDKEAAELKEKLASLKASFTKEDLEKLNESSRKLKEFQSKPSTKEELDKIPKLTRKDISKNIKPLKNIEKEVLKRPLIWHDINTQGILYFRLNFDISDAKESDLKYFGVLTELLGLIDNKLKYDEFVSKMLEHTGGITTNIESYTGEKVHLHYSVSFKSLATQAKNGIPLILDMLYSSRISEDSAKRILDVLKEALSNMEMDLEASGDRTSAQLAKAEFSVTSRIGEKTSGLAYYDFIKKLVENFETEKACLFTKLNELISKYFVKERAILSVTSNKEVYDSSYAELEGLIAKIPSGEGVGKDLLCDKLKTVIEEEKTKRNKLLSKGYTASGQVLYVTRAGNFKTKGLPYTGVLNVLQGLLNFEYLWVKVRVEGGAYGCYVRFNRNGDTNFSSYRDPKIIETNKIYESVPKFLEELDLDEAAITKFVIGAIGNLDSPLTPLMDGERSFNAYMTDLTEEELKKYRKETIETSLKDLKSMSKYINAILDENVLVALGSETKIKERAGEFDEIRSLLS